MATMTENERYAIDPEYRERKKENARRRYRESTDVQTQVKARAALSKELVRARLATERQQPCIDCGLTFPPVVMQFHHRDPATKKYTVGACPTIATLERELEKCDVICANCHCLRHGET